MWHLSSEFKALNERVFMKLNANQIMTAERSFRSLLNTALPYRYSRQIDQLKRWLEAECVCIAKAQVNLVKKYYGAIHEGGSITFDDPEMQKLFIAEADRQFLEDIDYDPPICDLRGGCDELTISAAEISALDGLVLFD